ncbi:hypothetical protein NFI95_07945 [Acetobacteraceae bacterium KSS8]|uniref:Secreted protein n=1 Tax=Endosaccharibacter trunci TaxID=2812733 RepID=A0ABT1W6A2_9PROT|nr:hypothetical protein [Acetobacteraceae bacterium KSS8]
MIRTALLCTALLAPASAAKAQPDQPASPGAEAPMVVTSDTDAYCAILSRQIDEHGDPLPQPVASLRDQGQRMCANGQVRSGINRLRRALLALHRPEEPADAATDGNTPP